MRTLAGLAVLLLVLAPAAPASADRAGVGLSFDGVTFEPDLHHSLFPAGLRWVPGDVQESSFYVRNDGSSTARMDIEVLGSRPNGLLSTGELGITARVAGGAETAATNGRLASGTRLAPGQVLPVTIRVAYSSASQNGTQLLASDLDFRVTLSGDGGSMADVLPDTGAGLTAVLAVTTAALLGAGTVLMTRRSGRSRLEGAPRG